MKKEVKCRLCGKIHEVIVNEEGFKKWVDGEPIEKALPQLTKAEHDLLKYNVCGPCFEQLTDR